MDAESRFPAVNAILHELPDAVTAELAPAARLAALGELTSGTIHAVNNAVFAVLANVELMLDGEPPAGDADRLRLVRESALELRETLRRLAKVTRGEAAPGAAFLDEEVRTMLDVLRRTSRVEGVAGRYPEEPLAVLGDATDVRQAVLHVLLHAASAAGRRGSVAVEVARVHDGAAMRVTAAGAAEPRGDEGLGLVVANAIARRLGGRLEAEGPDAFRLELPTP